MKRILIDQTPEHSGEKIKVCGWVQSRRAHGKVLFLDLRDKSGILQIVFSPSKKDLYSKAKDLRPEWVIEVKGEISSRPEGMKNPKIKTGNIELKAESLNILSEAQTLPFPIDTKGYKISEQKRLKYRYLDLRRKRLVRNLKIRHKVIQFMRDFLNQKGFLEVETPILTKSTPEGARDFLVPSRLEPGKFYALPQSPQQYKQMLMVAGIEKYFQIARALRDEDPRADRQAEHTQLDIEVSFKGQKEILDLVEQLYISLVKKLFPQKKILQTPFPRLTYKEAMKKYGTDRPDLRKKSTSKDSQELAFAFVTDFPMFEKKEEKWSPMHHPFTKPQTKDPQKIKKHPQKILAYQYDLVLNGEEIGGGSLRTTDLEVLGAVFEVLGHKISEIKKKFGHYFKAFKYGVPPHGGIAPGIDRFLAVILEEPNIREVIAFPKTGDNRDLMMGVPSKVTKEQLKELHLKIRDTQEDK